MKMLCISLEFRSRDDSRDEIGNKNANYIKSIAFDTLISVDISVHPWSSIPSVFKY